MFAMYVFPFCLSLLNLAFTMLEPIAGMVTCLVEQMVFKCVLANFTCLVFTS